MAKESLIRKKAVDILSKEKWMVWWPAKVKFKQNDIFGAFDIVCCKKGAGTLKFIQLTTAPNLSARRKKIQAFLKRNGINGPKIVFGAEVEIWAWAEKHKKFKIETL
jgi:hypothetical protein